MRTTGATAILALMLLAACADPARAQSPVPLSSGIWQSRNPSHALSVTAQERLLASLKRITGIERFAFTADGRLDVGDALADHEGSPTARRILQDVLATGDILVLEEHSNSTHVTFGQIEGMDYSNDATGQQARVWWVRLDVADFRRIAAAPRVRASFDEGFTFLHELLHSLGHDDTTNDGEIGHCEAILNQVRREVALPLRLEYLAIPVRSSEFGVVSIRLRFSDRLAGGGPEPEHDLHFTFSTIVRPTQPR